MILIYTIIIGAFDSPDLQCCFGSGLKLILLFAPFSHTPITSYTNCSYWDALVLVLVSLADFPSLISLDASLSWISQPLIPRRLSFDRRSVS